MYIHSAIRNTIQSAVESFDKIPISPMHWEWMYARIMALIGSYRLYIELIECIEPCAECWYTETYYILQNHSIWLKWCMEMKMGDECLDIVYAML